MSTFTAIIWQKLQASVDNLTSIEPKSRIKRYSFVFILLGAWMLSKLALVSLLDINATTHLITLIVIFSALYGGLGPGLLATLLGGIFNDFLFLYPKFTFLSAETEFTTISFFLTGLVISLIIEALRQAKLQKSEFMGFAAHEIKNPLATILGYADLIKRKSIDRNDKQFFEFGTKISQQVTKSTHIINDLLDITRIEAGKLTYDDERFSLYELISEIVEIQNGMTKNKKITLSGKSKKQVFGDKQRIGQVVLNLINNALKYSPNSDKVDIKIKNSADSITVQFKDHGLGVDPRYIGKIFDPFFRITKGEKQKLPGSGVGLYFSNEVVKRHKGKLSVKSQLGRGSTFFLTLPVAE